MHVCTQPAHPYKTIGTQIQHGTIYIHTQEGYSPLLGAYVILGLTAAACATAATVLLTFLALHSRRCVVFTSVPFFGFVLYHRRGGEGGRCCMVPVKSSSHPLTTIILHAHTAASGGVPGWG